MRITVTNEDEIRVSTASAIDLAGSEDNRRTDNGKERLVESASINKSLFVLAQCVEAISRKQTRIPYRESKMTRILSLGQNNGLTIMILNLAPVRSYHLDTLSSLNFANRTKKIEVREVENEPIFKGCSRPVPAFTGSSLQRQPLRPLASTVHNASIRSSTAQQPKPGDKPLKAFTVYADRSKPRHSNPSSQQRRTEVLKRLSPLKRPLDSLTDSRPAKQSRPSPPLLSKPHPSISQAAIEDIIEKKVTEILATRALEQPSACAAPEISEEVQRRLEMLEQRIEGKDDSRAEGLTFLLMAKQHHVRGEDTSALKMYELAKEYFPDNAKLNSKIMKLREKLEKKRDADGRAQYDGLPAMSRSPTEPTATDHVRKTSDDPADDDEYQETAEPIEDLDYESDDGFRYKSKTKNSRKAGMRYKVMSLEESAQTPRTRHLLDIINSRDIAQIRLLKGVGAKKAEVIVEALCAGEDDGEDGRTIGSLGQLGRLKGVGAKTVENMRTGLGYLSSEA